jgi:hypothetical protein
MKKLITLISTAGKTKEEMIKEVHEKWPSIKRKIEEINKEEKSNK